MKKSPSIFFVFLLVAFPGTVKADGLDKLGGLLSLSCAIETSNQTNGGMDVLLGIGLNVPLLFNGKISDDEYFPPTTYLMIEPMISTEYSFSSNLFRIRTGAHFGKFHESLASFGYYAGLSGSFIKDFANNTFAFGISPEIGVEWFLLFIGFRFQAQYDLYTIERYNRFVVTVSFTVPIFGFDILGL